jgi:hypothetical protein
LNNLVAIVGQKGRTPDAARSRRRGASFDHGKGIIKTWRFERLRDEPKGK